MKNTIARIIIIAMLACWHYSAIYSHAEERSDFQIGKTWIYRGPYSYYDLNGNPITGLQAERSIKVIGDTLINNVLYAITNSSYIIYDKNGEIFDSSVAIHGELYSQENGKYYRSGYYLEDLTATYAECGQEPQLFLDFSAKKGDRLDILDMLDNTKVYDQYEVADVALIPIYGIDRKVLTLRCGAEKFYWIEGIGCHLSNLRFKYGGFLVYSDGNPTGSGSAGSGGGNNSFSIECVFGDELLYSWHDFERQMQEYEQGLMAIDQIAAERENDTTLYDLTGRRIEGNPMAGIYIRGGKKIVINN